MDELDKKLYLDLNSDIEIPSKLDFIIKDCFKQRKKQHSFFKVIISTCAGLIITMGIAYAGTTISNYIFKQPEKVVGGNQNTVTQEEKQSVISETEARKKSAQILNKFGYQDSKIETIELVNNSSNYELHWYIKTNNDITISLNANDESSFNLWNDSVLNKDIENYRTTQNEAEETARALCKKYGYNLDSYTNIKVTSNMNSEKQSYIWYANFYKEYDGIINLYENIRISFIPEINEIIYFSTSNRACENNPIEITEEQAKEIVLKEEQKISTKYEISNINTELSIVSINGEAYLRTTDYEQFREQTSANYPMENWVNYRTDQRVRKAWIVTVKYNIPDSVNKFDDSYNKNDEQFSYYIDVTTGEVIGGCSNYELMVKKLYK